QAQALAQLGRVAEAAEAADLARGLAEEAGDRTALRQLDLLKRPAEAPAALPDAADLPAVLQRTLAAFVALARAQRGFLLLYQGFEVTAKLAVGAVGPGDDAFSATLAHRVMWQGAPLWIDDLQQHPALAEAASVQALGLRAVLGVPLEHAGEVIGVLLADSTDVTRRFDPADMDAALALAREAAGAIATARRLQAAEAGLAAAQQLHRLALAAAGATDLASFWPILADAALALTGAERSVYLTGPLLAVAAHRGPSGTETGLARPMIAWVRDHGEPLHLHDAHPGGLRTVWAAPAGHDGVLYLDSIRIAPADPAVLSALAGMAEILGAVSGRGATARSGV
ncbi:MAG: hypothetical protein JWM80_2887, partial [Cyanobacteria bacterium RYN_339]|nr:hypothetical protein [Cyanobacteria bacterium RYN_339]